MHRCVINSSLYNTHLTSHLAYFFLIPLFFFFSFKLDSQVQNITNGHFCIQVIYIHGGEGGGITKMW